MWRSLSLWWWKITFGLWAQVIFLHHKLSDLHTETVEWSAEQCTCTVEWSAEQCTCTVDHELILTV